jgi:hypothetical protein
MTKSNNVTGTRIGAGCLALFALPFAGVALFMAWKLGAMLWLAAEARSWVVTPATIVNVELKRFAGEDNDTFAVIAAIASRAKSITATEYALRPKLITSTIIINSFSSDLTQPKHKGRRSNVMSIRTSQVVRCSIERCAQCWRCFTCHL